MSYTKSYSSVVARYSEQSEVAGFHQKFHDQAPGEELNSLVYADWLRDQGKETLADIVSHDATVHRKTGPGASRNTPYVASSNLFSPNSEPGKWVVFRDHAIFEKKHALSLVQKSVIDPRQSFWWTGSYSSEAERDEALKKAIEEGAEHLPHEDTEAD